MHKRFLTTVALALSVGGPAASAQVAAPPPASGPQPSVAGDAATPKAAPTAAPSAAPAPSATPTASPAAPAGVSSAPPAAATTKTAPAAAPAGAPSTLASLPIVRATLKNGLRVVMTPDRTIPTVGIALFYDVGSRNEVRGRSGFAHLFEHMMFQGSANVAKGEHFQLVLNRGGEMNGTTSEDRTNYYETLPSNELPLGLWLEADRMKSLAITQDNFENQRQTVMEERRQSYDNQPYAKSWLRVNELAFGDYFPYSHSTIGDMKDLENAPLTAVQEFFDAYYAPNNAVLSLAGDFDPTQALALVEKYFGDIPSRSRPPYEPGELSPQTEERRESMLDPLAQLSGFHVAYHIPSSREPDHYPLDILAMALGDGESSRLYQELVKKRELLSSLNVGTDSRRGPDLFSFWCVVAEGKEAKQAQDVIFAEIEKVAKQGLSARELDKAKNRVRSSFVFGLSSTLSRALTLGTFELYFGNAELLKTELDRYLAVTNDDVKRVAARYFAKTNRTVLDVVASPAEKSAEGAAK
ncbi:MAG TPA: pitrilysin family protein [Polyangiales bacterium]